MNPKTVKKHGKMQFKLRIWMHPLSLCQKRACSRASVGILQEVSGRQAEAENEHGKEQGDQYLRTEEIQVSWILFGQEWKRYLYPCAPKVSCQGEGKAETSYKAQPWTQCPQGNAGSEGVHPRLDWLLSSSRYETNVMSWDKWMRRRIRMYIWKQWKKPKTKVANLRKLGGPADKAYRWGNSRLGCWRIAGSHVLECSITNERLAAAGYFSILNYYESLHLCG